MAVFAGPALAAPGASIPLASLLSATAPTLGGPGQLTACTDRAAPSDRLTAEVAAAEHALTFVDTPGALTHLDTAEALLPCLAEPPSSSVLARAAFLRGIADPPHAVAAFAEAHARRPDLVWDETFPPEARAAFEQGRVDAAALRPASLAIVPDPPPGTPWVDGRQAMIDRGRLDLAPGRRLIQSAGPRWESVVLTVASGDRPLLLRADAIAGHEEELLADGQRRAALAHALASTLPSGAPVTVSGVHGTWSLVVGEDWERVSAARPAGRVLALAGASLLAASAAVGAGSLIGFEADRQRMLTATSFSDAEADQRAGNAAGKGVQLGEWGGATGAALIGAGLLLQLHWGAAR